MRVRGDSVKREQSYSVAGEGMLETAASLPDESRGMRVYIVDDNEDAAVLLSQALEMKGHVTRAAFDPVTALKDISPFSPDVVLLDIGLPVIDGYELAQKFRQMPELRSARLFALTGHAMESDRKRSTECGFEQHLAKPIELDDLDSLIRAGGPGSQRA